MKAKVADIKTSAQVAACLLAVMVVDGRARCSYSRYIGYTQSPSLLEMTLE